MNNIEGLSKPVGFVGLKNIISLAEGNLGVISPNAAFGEEPVYSKEYVNLLIAQLEAAQKDATRWRALLSSPAIRILGHAGLQDDKPIDGRYCHFGMEIWSHHEPYYDNKKACELITRYADNMIAAGFTVEGNADAE